MRIQNCEFGKMVIDGREYTSDLIIFPEGQVKASWWRESGHRLTRYDIEELINSGPELIIAGTGAHGMMKPDKDLITYLKQKKIHFIHKPNPKVIRLYNKLSPGQRVGACFHLTC